MNMDERSKFLDFEGKMSFAFKEFWAKGKGKRLYEKMAIVVPSRDKTEYFSFIGQFPSIKGWSDEKIEEQFELNLVEITNKSWEATIKISRDDVLFDRFKLIESLVKQLSDSAESGYIKMFINLLKQGEAMNGYDGVPFFSNQHLAENQKMQSNILEYTLNQKSFNLAKETMRNFKSKNGDTYNMLPNTLVVPPALESVALDITKAQFYNKETKMFEGIADTLVLNELENSKEWFLMDLSQQDTVKPFILQIAQEYAFGLCPGENNNIFHTKRPVFGIDGVSNAAYGFWQAAVKGKGESILS